MMHIFLALLLVLNNFPFFQTIPILPISNLEDSRRFSVRQESPKSKAPIQRKSSRVERDVPCGVGKLICDYRNEMNSNVCFSPCQKCDGVADCPKATDELGCPCRSRIQSQFICDGKFDCSDFSDELGCGECLNDELRCLNECVSLNSFCNGQKCEKFSRPILCTRLTQQRTKDSISVYRSQGYLQKLIRNKWFSICGTLGGEIDQVVNEHCEAVTGVRSGKNIFKLEKASSSTLIQWSGLQTQKDIGPSAIPVNHCPQKMMVYVECGPPPCQNISKVFDLNDFFSNAQRIVGGVDASPELWSFFVSITKNGVHHCGGSIITPRWVITASHCFLRISGIRYEIRTGGHRRRSFGPYVQKRVVSHVIRYPGFDPYTLNNDIALVRLLTPLQFNRWTRPSCLSGGEVALKEGTNCLIVGLGFIMENGVLPDTLQEVAIPILNDTECLNEFNFVDLQKVFCAGDEDGGKDSCQGDSGGPLMCHDCGLNQTQSECEYESWYQVGLVSFGKGCARPGIPGVYTRIEFYKNWIFDTIRMIEENSAELPAVVPKIVCNGLLCEHSGGLCLDLNLTCDGKVHCFNAIDETDCVTTAEIDTTETIIINASDSNPLIETPIEDYDYEEYETEEFDHIDYDYFNTIQSDTLDVCPENHYQCEVDSGCIPLYLLCDETRNCRDGTDELGCACVDRLYLKQKEKICDGVFDCLDFSDELCDLCGNGNWLCPRSAQCIAINKKCDSVPNCRYGEDELHCLTLAPTAGELVLDIEGKPAVSSEGYLLYSTAFSNWEPVCINDIKYEEASEICSFLGYKPAVSITHDSYLPSKYEIRLSRGRSKRLASIPGAHKHDFQTSRKGFRNWMQHFNATHSEADETHSEFQTLSSRIRKITASEQERVKRMTCQQVNIRCGGKICGKVASLQFSHAPPLGSAAHVPWAVNVFSSGSYLCGGTLVGMQWVVSSLRCLSNVSLPLEDLHVLGGPHLAFSYETILGPYQVDIRVDAVVEVDEEADLVLLHLDSSIEHVEQLNAVCLESPPVGDWKECVMAGSYKDSLNHALLLVPNKAVDCADGQICFGNYLPQEDICLNSWSGLISCREERRNSYPWTAVAIWDFIPTNICRHPTNSHTIFTQDMRSKIIEIMNQTPVPIPSLPCDGHKCALGICIPSSQVCDAEVSCPDFSDEHIECPVPVKFCKDSQTSKSCDCSFGEFKCSDGVCLDSKNVCDGVAQCLDGDDEKNCRCSIVTNPAKGQILCDGTIDCNDESDELECECDLQEFRCFRSPQKSCISHQMICDGVSDCEDAEDEAFCVTISNTISPEENALGIPAKDSEGYLLIRVAGVWYTYLSYLWNDSASGLVCSNLGYSGIQETLEKTLPLGLVEGDLRSVVFNEEKGNKTESMEYKNIVYIECLL